MCIDHYIDFLIRSPPVNESSPVPIAALTRSLPIESCARIFLLLDILFMVINFEPSSPSIEVSILYCEAVSAFYVADGRSYGLVCHTWILFC
jgi:hypothetical protein